MVFCFLIKGAAKMQFRNMKEELAITKFKKKIEREIEEYFEDKGFSIIEPKTFQDYSDCIQSGLIKNPSETVKVLGGDSKIYILRPDITTNLLGQIFAKWEREAPLKIYYNSKIYRNGPRGEILQNYQMGIESLGDDEFKADKEIIEMALSVMSSLGEAYLIELGSSLFLDSFFREIKLERGDEKEIRKLISKKNYHGLKVKLKLLKLENTILDDIFRMQGNIEEVIDIAQTHRINEGMRSALESLTLLGKAFNSKDTKNKIKVDLSMVSELDYYDGIIFRGYCISLPTKILSGGRYDKSTAKYGAKTAAIGFMIDMDLVTQVRIKELK